MNAAVHYITGPALPFVALVAIGALIIAWAEHVAHLRRRIAGQEDDAGALKMTVFSLRHRARSLQTERDAARQELAEFRARFDRPRGDGGRYLPQSK